MSVLFLSRRFLAAQICPLRLLVSAAVLFLLAVTANAQTQTPVQIENAKPGTSSWVITNGAGNREIEGYASLTSVNRGGQISLFVSTADSSYTMEIYRLGWYNGAGARQVMSAVTRTGTKQTTPTPNTNTGMVECNWTNPYVLTIPNS
ncbi:MAG: hypothetical protein LC731_06445, partial [Acidobacteria bacterium]|nr:hypothetical protein [Acidobacteriota bacterium]